MKKCLALALIACLSLPAVVEARGGRGARGGGFRHGGGRHFGGRGGGFRYGGHRGRWHGKGRHWHRGGYWRRPYRPYWRGGYWGWGAPYLGVGLGPTIVLDSDSSPTYETPSVPVDTEDPYYRYINKYGTPVNRNTYKNWLYRNYSDSDADYWFNYYLKNH